MTAMLGAHTTMTKKKNAGHKSVLDMFRSVTDDHELVEAAEEVASRHRIVNKLLAERASLGRSQAEIAGQLGCSQSRVSKMESAGDDDWSLGDLRSYSEAVECDIEIAVVPRNMRPVDRVKCHAFAIKRHMDDMATLAQSDESIAEGVSHFFYEVFVNFAAIIGGAVKALPKRADGSSYCEFRVEQCSGDGRSEDDCEVDCDRHAAL